MLKKIKNLKIFLMYLISAGISFTLDLILFTLFSRLLNLTIGDYSILVATIIARIISSFVNYLLNRNKVFNNKKTNLYDSNSLIKYYFLVLINLCTSAILVYFIHKAILIDPTLIKIPVDVILFIINFFIQKYFIFKGSDGK